MVAPCYFARVCVVRYVLRGLPRYVFEYDQNNQAPHSGTLLNTPLLRAKRVAKLRCRLKSTGLLLAETGDKTIENMKPEIRTERPKERYIKILFLLPSTSAYS